MEQSKWRDKISKQSLSRFPEPKALYEREIWIDGVSFGATEKQVEYEIEIKALQAKCDRYEKALKDINRRAEYGKPIDLALGTKSGEMCIAIEIISRTALEDGKANEALHRDRDRICPNCKKVFNADRNGCCRECGSDEFQNQKGG